MTYDFHGTTIISVRRDGKVAIAGDGQITLGNTIMKKSAVKIRRVKDTVLSGFAGSTADAMTLCPISLRQSSTNTGETS